MEGRGILTIITTAITTITIPITIGVITITIAPVL
jgi:hypothetical protein